MQKSQKNSYRREQLKTSRILREQLPRKWIKLEYDTGILNLDGKPYKKAILDVAILLPSGGKIAIRLMGEIHNTSKGRKIKDEYQKSALEQNGWIVVDFLKEDMPYLWDKRNNKEIYEEAKKEVYKALGIDDNC